MLIWGNHQHNEKFFHTDESQLFDIETIIRDWKQCFIPCLISFEKYKNLQEFAIEKQKKVNMIKKEDSHDKATDTAKIL